MATIGQLRRELYSLRSCRAKRASDEDVVAVLRGCCSARDRLIVLLMARAGLRRGEVLGLRRSDVHLLADSRALGRGISRVHLHVVRRGDNPNRAAAKLRRQRAVPLDFVTVQAFDAYEFERMTVPAAASADFVFVNLFRSPAGAPIRLDAVNDLSSARGFTASTAGVSTSGRTATIRVFRCRQLVQLTTINGRSQKAPRAPWRLSEARNMPR